MDNGMVLHTPETRKISDKLSDLLLNGLLDQADHDYILSLHKEKLPIVEFDKFASHEKSVKEKTIDLMKLIYLDDDISLSRSFDCKFHKFLEGLKHSGGILY